MTAGIDDGMRELALDHMTAAHVVRTADLERRGQRGGCPKVRLPAA